MLPARRFERRAAISDRSCHNRTAEQPENDPTRDQPLPCPLRAAEQLTDVFKRPQDPVALAQCSPSAAGQLDKPELLLVGDTAPRSVGELRKGDPGHGFPTYPPRFVFSRPSGMEEMVL